MKITKLLMVAVTASAAILFSCKKSGTSSQFDKSYSAWLAYKSKVNNTYKYVALNDADTNAYSETTIVVTAGQVTERDYISYEYDYDPASKTTVKTLNEQWQETSGNLNTHDTEGALLYTLDDIYYHAQNLWLTADPAKNTVTFQTNNDGMISVAGYTPKICKNGCFIGVKIKSISN